jgi:hypothetical protein
MRDAWEPAGSARSRLAPWRHERDRHPARCPPAPAHDPPAEPARLRLFALGVALIALHVVDDSFLQPQPGTSATDHLVSGLVPLALLGLAAWAHPRLSGGRRGALARDPALAVDLDQ